MDPFQIRDCTIAAVALGEKVYSLSELANKLREVPQGSLYHHFWGGRLRPQFEHPEYHNDFAAWAHHALHDQVFAERLGVLNPQDYHDLADLREEMLFLIDERIDEREVIPRSSKEEPFHFVASRILVFSTPKTIHEPKEMGEAIYHMSLSSLFYHVIDANRRTKERSNDFCVWLRGFGQEYDSLAQKVDSMDIYFLTLQQLKNRLVETMRSYFR
ncbi:MAG: hypothetical protein KDK65_06215 [Chlamydiia bacterium]|nr:hypothetical protein [Chlamydiia bacterium]